MLFVCSTGDDFWCTDPSGDPNGTFWLQGCHMVHCAYNSLWMGNFIQPDWDMFQSTHPCAEFHAASRAISGGPIYVSDTVGKHNFPLLKRLAMPDGSILRCESYALPTKDCLFEDPLHDGKTMLKIWNLNKVSLFSPFYGYIRFFQTFMTEDSLNSLLELSEHSTAKEEDGAVRLEGTNAFPSILTR